MHSNLLLLLSWFPFFSGLVGAVHFIQRRKRKTMEACPTCGADLSRETIEATPEATTPETTTPDLLEPGLIPEKNILRFRRLLTSDGLFKQAVYSDDTLSELEPISWSEYYGLGDE